ncbi:MAG: hypothetical protein A2X40_01610 [Elusimicrobia bacterium GWC2_65_9]|nr:MAG: hypothetical protein A2X37_04815 [Elusimicrobia bacterium GWA2_66_18]OGR71928.1 MAG: hypothetical protein A2X40_01610 [Elusimicrobia bacterium GWC2_65_9]
MSGIDARPGLEFLWFVQDLCNYKCPYCFVSGQRREARPWLVNTRPTAPWVEAWDRVADLYGPAWIRLTGGEPTRLPGFLGLIGAMTRRHSVSFDTNMSWSRDEIRRFAELVPNDRTTVDVSLHPSEGYMSEVLAKCVMLKERGYKLIARLVGYPPLLDQASRLRSLFGGAGLRFIVNPYQGEWQGREYPRDYTAAERRTIECASTALDPALAEDREQVEIAAHILRMHEESPRGRLCRSGSLYARVMHDGSVYRCQPYESRGWETLGNLLDADFRLRGASTPCRSDLCEFEYKYLAATETVR